MTVVVHKERLCPYCSGELQPGTIESVHAIYWCPQTDKNKNGLLLPRSKKDAQLISSGRMFFYASARRCPKCNVIIVEPSG